MAAGLGVLGLTPAAFWSLTPRELDAALTGRFGERRDQAPLVRTTLDDLMQRFPDREQQP